MPDIRRWPDNRILPNKTKNVSQNFGAILYWSTNIPLPTLLLSFRVWPDICLFKRYCVVEYKRLNCRISGHFQFRPDTGYWNYNNTIPFIQTDIRPNPKWNCTRAALLTILEYLILCLHEHVSCASHTSSWSKILYHIRYMYAPYRL